jgi:hypothetical protein
MTSRRSVLAAGGSLAVSAMAGCLGILRGDPSTHEVNVLLDNGGDVSQTFRFALETEAGELERGSRAVKPNSRTLVSFDLPPDSTIKAFHGTINDNERTLEFDSADASESGICMYLYFRYQRSPWDGVNIARDPKKECK